MIENDFQRALIDTTKELGGWGIKLSNRFLAGIPDLGECFFIECKRKGFRRELAIDQKIRIETTAIQRAVMRAMQHAGANVAVVLLIDINPQYIFISRYPEVDFCIWGRDDFLRRKRGEPWPIKLIMNYIEDETR